MSAPYPLSRDSVEIQRRAHAIRVQIVRMVGTEQKGHLGGSCSIADVVAALYFGKMRHDPAHPAWPDRDRLVLSKGHAALVQYAALAECGYFPKEELHRVKSLGSILQGHPDLTRTPGVEANTGSLGQGLSMAAGLAAGLRLDRCSSHVYCIVGDGEMAEGQIWEAAMAAFAFRLDRLVVILDCNGLQATGPIIERFDTGPYAEKWRAFGWQVKETDGHAVSSVLEALDWASEADGQPRAIVAHTVKGRGISFAEHNAAFHNGSLTREQYEMACRELGVDPYA